VKPTLKASVLFYEKGVIAFGKKEFNSTMASYNPEVDRCSYRWISCSGIRV